MQAHLVNGVSHACYGYSVCSNAMPRREAPQVLSTSSVLRLPDGCSHSAGDLCRGSDTRFDKAPLLLGALLALAISISCPQFRAKASVVQTSSKQDLDK